MNLGELSWREAGRNTGKVVVVPLAACEQHGHHLPLLTDALIGEAIVRRAQAELGDEALFAPVLWLGHSPHHLAFPGTLSVSGDTYVKVIEDLAESLLRGGFGRILFFNAHGGNVAPANLALSNVQMRHAHARPDAYLAFASWWSLAAGAIREEMPELKQSKISHACEWETSVLLHTRPDLVGQERPASRTLLEVEGYPSRFWVADYSSISPVDIARTIDQNSASGAFGWPELASANKGEAIITVAARELAAFVREFARWPAHLSAETKANEAR